MVEPNADCCGCWPNEVWPNVWPPVEVEAKADWDADEDWLNADGWCVEADCPKAEVEAEEGLLACVLWFKAV